MIVSRIILAGLAASTLSACELGRTETEVAQSEYFQPEYLKIETRLLDNQLVNFLVEMKGARTPADVADYAKCAASQYALIRGFGFARHVRTNVAQEDGLWRGDAVYTVSAALPKGALTLDAEVVVANCQDDGIPTV
jgi:hypothetical protein